MKKFALALLLASTIASAHAQTSAPWPVTVTAPSVTDFGNGPLSLRLIKGNAFIYTSQGSGVGSTAGSSTALTLTAVPTTPPCVGCVISGVGVTSGTTVTAYSATSITLSSAMTIASGTTLSWGAACPSTYTAPYYIQGSTSAGYWPLYTQARICATSPGGPSDFLVTQPIFYDQIAQINGFANPTASVGLSVVNGSALTAMRSDAAPPLSQAIVPVWTGIHTFNADAYFKSGRPYADIKAYGAVGNASTDDTAAVQAAVNAINALAGSGNGVVYAPPGNYCIKTPGGVVNNGTFTRIIGASQGTFFQTCGVDTTVFTLNGRSDTLENVFVQGAGVNATNPAVVFGSSCVECNLDTAYVWNGKYALQNLGVDTFIRNSNLSLAYGSAVIWSSANFYIERAKIDQGYPVSRPAYGTSISAWTNAHAYTVGTIVSTGGYYIQATVGGTSGAIAPTVLGYGANITDNTVTWQLVAPTTYYGIQVAGSFFIASDVDLTAPYTAGIALIGGSSTPQSSFFSRMTFGEMLGDGIKATLGNAFTVTESQFSNCTFTNCAGVNLAASFAGEATIANNLMFQLGYGVLNNSGNNNVVAGNAISGTQVAAVGVAANINKFTVSGNMLGSTAAWGVNPIGVSIAAGTSDYYSVLGNNFNGATVGLSDGGTGLHKSIVGNVGMATPYSSESVGTLINGTAGWSYTATMPATITSASSAVAYSITGAGSSNQPWRALLVTVGAGYTGPHRNQAINGSNSSAGTGNTLVPASNSYLGNAGTSGTANGTGALNIGTVGLAQSGTTNVGSLSLANVAQAGATNIGLVASGLNTDGAAVAQIGAFISLGQTTQPTVSAALIADNGSQAAPIQLWRDNGTTVAALADGGNLVLSQALMVGSNTALTLTAGSVGIQKITASASAPGAAGGKIELVCGTGAGTAKIIAYAGTSATPVTLVDNIGAAVTGC